MTKAKLSGRVSKLEARADQHDREMAAIRKVMAVGMKMLARNEAIIEKLGKSVDRFIRSLEGRNLNGHSKTKL